MIDTCTRTTNTEGPEGSIFLSKDALLAQFLAFEGEPVDILEKLARVSPDSFLQTCDRLMSCILQSRGGVVETSCDTSDPALIVEIDRRMEFYLAAEAKLSEVRSRARLDGRLVLSHAV